MTIIIVKETSFYVLIFAEVNQNIWFNLFSACEFSFHLQVLSLETPLGHYF